VLRPSDLGKYLLYDANHGYLTSDGLALLRQTSLASDITEVDGKVVVEDRLQSEGEWQLLPAVNGHFMLQHIKSATFIGRDATMVAETDAADLEFVEQSDCATFPALIRKPMRELPIRSNPTLAMSSWSSRCACLCYTIEDRLTI